MGRWAYGTQGNTLAGGQHVGSGVARGQCVTRQHLQGRHRAAGARRGAASKQPTLIALSRRTVAGAGELLLSIRPRSSNQPPSPGSAGPSAATPPPGHHPCRGAVQSSQPAQATPRRAFSFCLALQGSLPAEHAATAPAAHGADGAGGLVGMTLRVQAQTSQPETLGLT